MIWLDHTDKSVGEYENLSYPLAGYWWETERQVCIPWIASASPIAFLSFLRMQQAKGKAVVFPTVINGRLVKLLKHKGYIPCMIYVDYVGEDTVCLVLRPEVLALKELPCSLAAYPIAGELDKRYRLL